MVNRYPFLLLILLFSACGNREKQPVHTYFGGEIVNPTTEYVVLFKGEEAIDSARLNDDNRFEIKLDSLEDGLYHFTHMPEMQYVYLESGDSLQIRLNTVAFDESLIFSGRGEAINNFQLELFLEAEKEEQLIRQFYTQLEPAAFTEKLDSLSTAKLNQLDLLKVEEGLTDAAYDLALASIQYQNWFYKEGYPYWHRKASDDKTLHNLPEDFYDYRGEVSYNNPRLTFLRPYYDFMIYHIGNLAYMGCRKNCDTDIDNLSSQLHFNRHQLALIDSLVPEKELRDNLFRTVAFNYLLKHDTEENFETFMEDFHQRSANNRHLGEIERLSEGIRNLRPDHPLPELKVVDIEDNRMFLSEIPHSGQEVVFYFWSGPEVRHLRNISLRVRELKERHPEYRFVGICLRTEPEQWRNLIGNFSLDPQDQYLAENFEEFAHTLIVYNPYKSIIAKDGIIIDGFANLNSSF